MVPIKIEIWGYKMGYLVCEKCGGYYELKEGESIDDFDGCECGGKFRYVESLDEVNIGKDQPNSNSLICPHCGEENSKNGKFCGSCGKWLSLTKDSKFKAAIFDKLFKNKHNYGLVCIGIIGIVLLVFLITWLPGVVFANHYENKNIAFNYPNNLNGHIYSQGLKFEPKSNDFYIGILYLNTSIASPLYDVNTSKSKNITKNGLKMYEFGPDAVGNSVVYSTFVTKGDTQCYLICFSYLYNDDIKYQSNYGMDENATEGYNAYNQILNSFQIK